jgi:hypothetical protein
MHSRASADFIRQTPAGPQTTKALRFGLGHGIRGRLHGIFVGASIWRAKKTPSRTWPACPTQLSLICHYLPLVNDSWIPRIHCPSAEERSFGPKQSSPQEEQ